MTSILKKLCDPRYYYGGLGIEKSEKNINIMIEKISECGLKICEDKSAVANKFFPST